MANVFDKFDAPKTSTNVFDQFSPSEKKSNVFDTFDQKYRFDTLHTDPTFVKTAAEFYKGIGKLDEKEAQDPKKITQAFIDDQVWTTSNTASAAKRLDYLYGGIQDEASPEQKKRLAYLRGVWEKLPSMWEEGGRKPTEAVLSYAAPSLLDPVNLLGGVAGRAAGTAATRFAVPVVVDTAVGGAMEGAQQASDIEVGARKDYDLGQIGTAAGISAVGTAGSQAILGKLFSKGKTAEQQAADKLAEETIVEVPVPEFRMPEIQEHIARAEPTPDGTVPKYAGSINLNNINTVDEAKNLILETQQVLTKEIDEARRGVRPMSKTLATAIDILEKNPQAFVSDKLLKRKKGEALNADEILASRLVLMRSSENLMSLASKAANGTDVDKLAFAKALSAHNKIQTSVAGAATEAGRALNIFNMKIDKSMSAKALEELLQSSDGLNISKLAKQVAAIGDPDVANKYLQDAAKPGMQDKLQELWYNSLLSGISTQFVNFSSPLVSRALINTETALASGLGSLRQGIAKTLGKETSQDRVFMGEIGANMKASVRSTLEATKLAAKTFQTGEPSSPYRTTMDIAPTKSISGLKGKIIRTPSNIMAASDEFWKTVIGRGAMTQAAYRRAKELNLPNDQIDVFVSDVLNYNNKAASMPDNQYKLDVEDAYKFAQDFATKDAEYSTYTQAGGPIVSLLTRIRNQTGLAGSVVLPFIRTPANIFMFTFERTPAAFLMNRYKDAIKRGGADADMARARVMLGTSLMGLSYTLAQQGIISGSGPKDPGERAVWLTENVPYSIRLSDNKPVSYLRATEPVSTLMGLSASFAEASKDMDDASASGIASYLMSAFADTVQNKTFLGGVSNLIDAINRPEQEGEKYLAGVIGSLAVPTIVANWADANDPMLRDAKDIFEVIQKRTGLGRENLAKRVDIRGDFITLEKPAGTGLEMVDRMASPFYTRTDKDDPVLDEMIRLKYPVAMPKRAKLGVQLDDKQFELYSQFRNKIGYTLTSRLIQTPGWEKLLDSDRQTVMRSAYEIGHKSAMEKLIFFHPELTKNIAYEMLSKKIRETEASPESSMSELLKKYFSIDTKEELNAKENE